MLNEILGPTGGQVTVAQECARAVLVLAYGLTLVRLSGRGAFGKWSALDIIVSIMVGSTLSRALTGSAPLPGIVCGKRGADVDPLGSRPPGGTVSGAVPRSRGESSAAWAGRRVGFPEAREACGERSRYQRGTTRRLTRTTVRRSAGRAGGKRKDLRAQATVVPSGIGRSGIDPRGTGRAAAPGLARRGTALSTPTPQTPSPDHSPSSASLSASHPAC